MAKQVKIPDELHGELSAQKSDTNVPIPIGSAAEQAVRLYLNQRRLNAMIMRAYQSDTLDDARRVLRDEVAAFLGIPKEYLFTD